MHPNRKQLVDLVLEDIRSTFRRVTIASRSDMCEKFIPRSQAVVMHVVGAHQGINVKDVAIMLDISPSAATQLIDLLVKDGIINRRPSERDRRVVTLELSKEGKVRHRKYKAFQQARLHPIMEVLSDVELIELARLMGKIHQEFRVHPSMKEFTPASQVAKV